MEFCQYLKENLLRKESEILEESSSYFQSNFSN
jgi:hypothetical protein